jgi:hypothetical protein
MSYRESDIAYENPKAWVLNDKKGDCYTVFIKKLTHSVSDSSYARDEDGLSIAKARADYFHKRSLEAA